MIVKIGDQIYFAGKQTIVMVLEPDDNREFSHLSDDQIKCCIHDTSVMSEEQALELLKNTK